MRPSEDAVFRLRNGHRKSPISLIRVGGSLFYTDVVLQKSRCAFKPEALGCHIWLYRRDPHISCDLEKYKNTVQVYRICRFWMWMVWCIGTGFIVQSTQTKTTALLKLSTHPSDSFRSAKPRYTEDVLILPTYTLTDSAQPCSHSGPLWFSECR